MAAEPGFERFKTILGELFQLDDEPLDSGIHRILGLKRRQLEDLLTGPDGLVRTVEDALGAAHEQLRASRHGILARFIRAEAGQRYQRMLGNVEENREELRSFVEKNAPADELPRLLAALDEGTEQGSAVSSRSDLEAAVYNHLAGFFELYYANGDFGYRSRSSPSFSIPYDGRDVHFHWKFRGSYYIKSERTLPAVEFTPDMKPRRRIRYGLVAPSGEEPDGPAEDVKLYALQRVSLKHGVCTVGLRLAPTPTPKVELYAKIAEAAYGVDAESAARYLATADGKPIFKDPKPDSAVIRDGTRKGLAGLRVTPDEYVEVLARQPTFRSLARNVRERVEKLRHDDTAALFLQLDRYFNRFLLGTDADYFVQQDLGSFLRRERDRFVKDVIFADMQSLLAADPASPTAAIATAFDAVAERIIDVLETAEAFERDLFLLAKKVTRTDYLISLGKLPKRFHRKVFANKRQLERFAETFGVRIRRINDLEKFPTLPVDTSLFEKTVAEEFVGHFADLDRECSGLAIKADNLHALALLAPGYAGSVRFTYIDPPYNTGSDGFLYKDNFRHASWLSMVEQALAAGDRLVSEDGCISISVDDIELAHLCEFIDLNYGSQNELARLVWDRNRKNDAKFFSVGHEYMVVLAKNKDLLRERGTEYRESKPGAKAAREYFEELVGMYGDDWDAIGEEWRRYVRELADPEAKKWLSRYRAVGPDEGNPNVDPTRGPYRTDRDISWHGGSGPDYEVLHPKTGHPVPVPPRGWAFANPEALWRAYDEGLVRFGPDHTTAPTQVTYLSDAERQVMASVQRSYAQTAAQELKRLFGRSVFDNPKNWRDIRRLCTYLSRDGDTVLDYFAGSGTTGHAVLELNRSGDFGRRDFILIDNGTHFDTVLVPRLERVMFSSTWADGSPVDAGESGCETIIKIQELETFEDVLDRLAASDEGSNQAVAAPRYMFRAEAQDIRRGRVAAPHVDGDRPTARSVLDLLRPFSNEITISANGERRTLDLLETYCYLKGYRLRSIRNHQVQRRKYRVAHTDTNRLVVFRDIAVGENDVAALRALAKEYDATNGLDVNGEVDRRHLDEDLDVATVTSADFDVGASWS